MDIRKFFKSPSQPAKPAEKKKDPEIEIVEEKKKKRKVVDEDDEEEPVVVKKKATEK
jgi:hypothetical protein